MAMETSKILFPFLLLLIVISINISTSFKCGADELDIKPIEIETKQKLRKQKATGYTPIKIKADYSSFSSSDTKIKELVESTIKEFSKFLNVQHENDVYLGELSKEKIKRACQVDQISDDYKDYLNYSDLVILPYFNSSMPDTVLAAAGACIYNSKTSKPYVGLLMINPKINFNIKNIDLYMKQILLHEITHVLGFTNSLFSKKNLMEKINGLYFITSPKALEKARKHFNCKSLTGIQLENQGGEGSAGSHWEAKNMLGDYMISTNYADSVISDITLALLEDTGFYQVNYYSGGLFKFGKNKGCGFFNNKCINNDETNYTDEFCTDYNEETCSNTRTNKGHCYLYRYTSIPQKYRYFKDPSVGGFLPCDYCPVSNVDGNEKKSDYFPTNCQFGTSNLADYGEKIGKQSFCFKSSLLPSSSKITQKTQAICYEVECDTKNKEIIIKYDSTQIKCPKEGGPKTQNNFKGVVDCPKYSDICTTSSDKICNDMFDCLDKQATTDESGYIYDPSKEDSEKFTLPKGDEEKEEIPVIKTHSYCLRINLILLLLSFCFCFK